MGKFEVTAAQLRSAVSELTAQNSEFAKKVSELEALRAELAGQWKGESNDAFNAAFNQDKEVWDSFYKTMGQYIEGLNGIIKTYEEMEAKNVTIAKSK